MIALKTLRLLTACGLAAAFTLALLAGTLPASATAPAGYTLSWSDEFNEGVGATPNSAYWNYDIGIGPNNDGWGNWEQEYYVSDQAHAHIISDSAATDGASLQMEATNDGNWTTYDYHSARINTQNKITTEYGYIELRAKNPTSQGIWPAFWALGTDEATVGWPECGEMDIMEIFGQNDGVNAGSFHMGTNSNRIDWSATYTLAGGATFNQAYHTFGLLWTSSGVTNYIDDVQYEYHPSSSPGWVFNTPFYWIINLAVGGIPPGDVAQGSTVFPQYLDIDYFRIYQPGPPTIPAAPTGLTAAPSSGQVALAWSASVGSTSYNIYRGTTSGGEASTPIATNVSGVTYTDTGLTNGVTYYYKVAAVNTAGTSSLSAEASAEPISGAYTVTDYLNDWSVVSSKSASWGLDSSNPTYFNGDTSRADRTVADTEYLAYAFPNITSFTALVYAYTDPISDVTIWYSTNNGSTYTQASINTGSLTPTTSGWGYYTVTNATALPSGVTNVKVQFTGTGNAWDPQLGQITINYGVASGPAAPTGLTANAGNGQVLLSWSGSSGATSYNVYRGTSAGGESATAAATGITTTTYTDTSVTNGTTYYYTVSALSSAGTSPKSNEASATPTSGAPAAPTGLTATAASAQVALSWTSSGGATSYSVYRGTSSGGESATAVATGVIGTIFTDTALTNGTTYYYKVAAANSGGMSGQSNEASATPEAAAPAAPTGLAATAGSGQVVLGWTAGSGATSYSVYRGTISGGESGTAIASGVATVAYTDSAVTNGTTYYYKVASVNASGTSAQSNEATATPNVVGTTSGSVSIDCGGTAAGSFVADADYSGGSVATTSSGIGTTDVSSPAPPQAVLQSQRTGTSFTYTLPGFQPNTSATVSLYFADFTSVSAGQREFNVSINGTSVEGNFDVFAYSGGQNQGIQENFSTTTNGSGQIVIALTSGSVGVPILNGITVSGTNAASAPSAPTGLTATAGIAQVILSWTASSGATSYSVYRGTTAGGESATAVATGVTATTYTNTGLTNGTTYYYEVAAVNAGGTSAPSNEASATPQVAPPPAPTGLTATAGSAQVILSWTASSGATSYSVYRGTTAGGESATAVATGVTSTTYTNTGLTNGTTYYYKVAAVNAGGTSAPSNEASATPQVSAPSAPTGLTATAGSAQVILGWTASSGATSYSVYRGTTAGGESAIAIVTGVTTTTYTNTGLTNGTTYYYKVAAVNAGGTSAQSGEASATPAAVAVPAVPTGLTATAGSGQVSLSWSVSAGATSYELYRGTASRGEGRSPVVSGIATTTYTDTGLTNGTAYYYYVEAVNSAGTSAASVEAHATPSGSSVPAAPTGLTATAGNAQVILVWTASSGATSYNVYRGTAAAGESATPIATGVTAATYTNTGLANGVTYYYKVAAVNASGTSGQSNEASASPSLSVPSAPSGLTATPANAQVTLSWTASSGATSYNVYRGTSAGGEAATAIAAGITTVSYTNTGITNGTTYYYKVAAVNSGGTSALSSEASATPTASAPAQPSGLTATAGNTQIVLSWTADAGATSYSVYRGTASRGEGRAAIVTGIATTTYTDTGLTNGTTYYYDITAVNGVGTSTASGEAHGTPTGTTPPAAPTGLGATAGSGQVALTWTASTGATAYAIYRGTASGAESATAIATGVATTTYTNTGLTSGTAYYYKVAAVNAGGTSAPSNEATATPTGSTAPAAPTGLTATAGSAQIALSWTASAGATSYSLYRGTASRGEGRTPLLTGITTATYTDTGLTSGTTYYYYLTAVGSGGTSAASAEAHATPS